MTPGCVPCPRTHPWTFPALVLTQRSKLIGIRAAAVWQDSAGPPMAPPFFASPDIAAWNFNMILAVYFALGWYMFKAGDKPKENKLLVGFVIWGNFAHLLVTVAVVLFNDDPAYSGPWPLSGLVGDLPPRVFGIAHWQNLLGDMPLVGLFVGVDAYLAYKVWGSVLLPWEV